jgi:hypothetical protein
MSGDKVAVLLKGHYDYSPFTFNRRKPLLLLLLVLVLLDGTLIRPPLRPPSLRSCPTGSAMHPLLIHQIVPVACPAAALTCASASTTQTYLSGIPAAPNQYIRMTFRCCFPLPTAVNLYPFPWHPHHSLTNHFLCPKQQFTKHRCVKRPIASNHVIGVAFDLFILRLTPVTPAGTAVASGPTLR